MRYELKFVLNRAELYKFKSWIISKTRFKKQYTPRIVNSIYFDDINNTSANDNLAGISLREKYRLRWYNSNFNSLAKFELKKRINRLNYKEFFKFDYSKGLLQNFSNKNFADICQNKLFEWNYRYTFELFPKIQIQYNREYYEDNKKVRLTIDKRIKFWKSLDDKQMFYGHPLDYDLNIAEIKFSPELYNYVSILLNQTRFIPKRHSKYLIGLALFDEVKYF